MTRRVFDLAVVGCGNVSRMHFEAYTAHPERVRVVAACDLDPDKVAQAQSNYGVEHGFTSLDEMIEKADWEIAVVCTPTPVRKETVEALARAGKHVFVEKPLADTYAEAKEIVDICNEAGVTLAVNQNFRYHYPFDYAKTAIEQGEIGNVVGIAHQDLSFRQDAGWRIESERHSLSVMGVHWLDGFRWILDDDVRSIVCETQSSPAINCVGETDAFIQMTFNNGVTASYVQSFSSAFKRAETVIIGDKGTLVLDYHSATLFDIENRYEPKTRWENPHSGSRKPEATFIDIDLLCTALEQGNEPPHSGRDNLKTIALLEAAYRSAETQQELRMDQGALV